MKNLTHKRKYKLRKKKENLSWILISRSGKGKKEMDIRARKVSSQIFYEIAEKAEKLKNFLLKTESVTIK